MMKKILSSISITISLLFPFFLASECATILVDGVSEWKNPTVHVGDSVIFKHKYHYNLYIFKNKNAFNLCNFTQATLLTKPNSNSNSSSSSSYAWKPSRPGFFYFAFNINGTLKTCKGYLKLPIEVYPALPPQNAASASPEPAPVAAPAPASGGPVVSSSPAYPWPFRPRQAVSPAPSSSASSPVTMPTTDVVPVPDKGGGIPFINSNPAVPLPTGEVDSATIRPLPTSASHHRRQAKAMAMAMVGFLTASMALFSSTAFLIAL